MTSSFLRGAAFALLLSSAALARAEPAIVALARAYVGTESALTAVKSIHFVGSFVTPDPTDAKKMTYVSMEMILQAPFQQRITASSDRSIEVTGLDNYEAWHRIQNPKDPTQWRLKLLGKDEIKRLRAETWETLAFYRGLEREGGEVADQGDVTVEGVPCRKVAFIHSGSITYFRFIDRATGRLVLTQTESGAVIREQGEIRVNGVRFPKTIVTTNKLPDGTERNLTITFDKITVNESFTADLFAFPTLGRH